MKTKINKKVLIVLSALLSIFISFSAIFCFTSPATVKADTATSQQALLDKVFLVGYTKGETAYLNRHITGVFQFDDGFFDFSKYEYGVIGFPSSYIGTKFERGNYHAQKEANGIRIQDIVVSESHVNERTSGSYLFFSITDMLDSNLDIVLFFCFYIKDKSAETYYYAENASFSCSYNGITNNNFETDLSQYVSLEQFKTLQDEKTALEESEAFFSEQLTAKENAYSELQEEKATLESDKKTLEEEKAILESDKKTLEEEKEQLTNELSAKENEYSELQEKYDELKKSVDENNDIDLNDYISKTSHEKQIAELNKKISELEKNDTSSNNSWLLIAGSATILFVLSLLLIPKKKR